MRPGFLTIFVVFLASGAPATAQQAPYLVKDINTVPNSSPGLGGRSPSPADSWLYLFGNDEVNGWELWRTQGTAATTSLVADLTPGPFGFPIATRLTTLGDVAFFTHESLSTGNELWRSDGTTNGTRIVRDIHVGPGSSNPVQLTTAGGLVYMVANDGSGPGLWRSDGTEAGTFLVHVGEADSLLAGDGPLFFVASTPATGRELWTSDGTPAGTQMVEDICPGPCDGAPERLTRGSTVIFFMATNTVFGRELWRSGGTAANTSMVTDFAAGTQGAPFQELATIGDVVYAGAPGLLRATAGGSFQLLLSTSFQTHALAASGTRMFFVTESIPLRRLWRTDGTGAGTFSVANLCTANCSQDHAIRVIGSSQYAFVMRTVGIDVALMRNDGTPGGSLELAGDVDANEHAVWDDRLYFTNDDGATGRELWRSDGTTAGTSAVFDLTDASSRPLRLLVAEDRLFFQAHNPGMGLEPWVTQGTAASTVGLDLVPGPDAYVSNQMGALGRDLVFSVDGGPGIVTRQLWKSDGTLAGTGSIANVHSAQFSQQSSAALFAGSTDGLDHELWRTDGTPAGTGLLKDLNPSGSSFPTPLSSLAGQRYLNAASPTFAQLWRTDGTAVGTVPVAALSTTESARLGSVLILSASATGDHELFRTDGTSQGTSLIKDIYPGQSSQPEFLTAAGGLVFFAADSPAGANRLWKTDGTEAGTTLIPESPGYLFAPMAELHGILYFLANDPATGIELWRSDGTGPGTYLVKDIAPGPDWGFLVLAGSTPLVAAGEWVWFSAYTQAGGLELWRSDGTAAGTQQFADVAAGGRSSWPQSLMTDGRLLYFVADDGVRGYELWAVDVSPTASVADASAPEGDAPGRTVEFTLTLSSPAQAALTVSYQTVDATAVAGLDYVAQSGTVTFVPGGQSAVASVPLLSDLVDEPDETFLLRLTPGTAGVADAEAVGVIQDDDEPRVLVRGDTVTEGDAGATPATFEVELTTKDGAATVFAKTVAFASEPLTAVSPTDFTAVSGTLTFAAGSPSGDTRTVTANVIGDLLDEPDERFAVRLTPTSDLAVTSAEAYGVILDDDGLQSAPPVELTHGSALRATLEPPAGRTSDRDWYVLRQQPRASYELVVDETSGDAVPLQVDRMGPDGSTVLQGAVADGTGASVSLRWENAGSLAVASETVRVGSAACGTTCGADDGYRVRFRETTLSAPRVNNTGSQITVAIVQNTTDATIAGRVHFWTAAGTSPASAPFQLAAHQVLVLNTSAGFPSSGTLTVTHDGPYGSLVGKAVALEPSTGFSFDTPMTYRAR